MGILILNRLKRFLPIQTKILICNSLVLSHLNFGILPWGFKCEKLFKFKKNIVRSLSLSKYYAHTDPLFKIFFKLQELKFYYKYKSNKLPHYLKSLPFHPNTRTHDHHSRIKHKINNPIRKHVFTKNCVWFDIPKIVNNCPNSTLDKQTLTAFRAFLET